MGANPLFPNFNKRNDSQAPIESRDTLCYSLFSEKRVQSFYRLVLRTLRNFKLKKKFKTYGKYGSKFVQGSNPSSKREIEIFKIVDVNTSHVQVNLFAPRV